MKDRWGDGRGRSRGNIPRVAGLIAIVYLLCMGSIWLVGSRLEGAETEKEAYGNLDERFRPTLSWTADGEVYNYYENRFTNILVIGTDGADGGAALANRGGQADFLLLLVVDRSSRTIIPIHIDRDTYTGVRVYGAFGQPAGVRDMQICLSHAFGSGAQACSENTADAVSRLLEGVRIDYYLTMSMDGIAALNDALGGVTVTLEEDFSSIDPAMTAGSTIRLQGRQAEYYVRGRYGVGDYSNEQRMRHQRSFIDAAIPLMRIGMESDGEFLAGLLDQIAAYTETNVTQSWLINQSHVLTEYEMTEIRTIGGAHRIGSDGFIEFHPDREALLEMIIDVFCESAEQAAA